MLKHRPKGAAFHKILPGTTLVRKGLENMRERNSESGECDLKTENMGSVVFVYPY